MHPRWPPMMWLGGAQGTGKSTLARRLAHEHDLPLHPLDAFTPPATTDATMAAGSEAGSEVGREAELRRWLADLRHRELPDVLALVEGPRLHPGLAAALPAGHAVFLVTTPDRLAAVRRERDGHGDLDALDDRDGEISPDALLQNDIRADSEIRAAARDAGLPVVEVPLEPDWRAVAAAVRDVLRPALSRARRLDPGSALRASRRQENTALCRRLQAYQRLRGLATTWRFPFACECGRSRCTATWSGRPEEYVGASLAGRARAPEHR